MSDLSLGRKVEKGKSEEAAYRTKAWGDGEILSNRSPFTGGRPLEEKLRVEVEERRSRPKPQRQPGK